MKIVTASNGKKSIKISKSEWKQIGKKAGWIKLSGNWALVQENNEKVNGARKQVKFLIDYCEYVIETSTKHQQGLTEEDNDDEISYFQYVAGEAKSFISTLLAIDSHYAQSYMSSGYAYDDDDPRNKMIDRDDDEAKYGDFGGDEHSRINNRIQREVASRVCDNEFYAVKREMERLFDSADFKERLDIENFSSWYSELMDRYREGMRDMEMDDYIYGPND